jgi:hypothetical protein
MGSKLVFNTAPYFKSWRQPTTTYSYDNNGVTEVGTTTFYTISTIV